MHHRVCGDRRGLRRGGEKRHGHQYNKEQINVKNSHNYRSRVYKNAR